MVAASWAKTMGSRLFSQMGELDAEVRVASTLFSGEARRLPPYERQTKEAAMIELREPAKGEINHRVYALYLMRGCEQGRDVEDRVRAEKELDDESVGRPAPTSASRLSELRYRWAAGI